MSPRSAAPTPPPSATRRTCAERSGIARSRGGSHDPAERGECDPQGRRSENVDQELHSPLLACQHQAIERKGAECRETAQQASSNEGSQPGGRKIRLIRRPASDEPGQRSVRGREGAREEAEREAAEQIDEKDRAVGSEPEAPRSEEAFEQAHQT